MRIKVRVADGVQLDVVADENIVVGYAAHPRRVIFVIVSPQQAVVASDDNSLASSTTTAVIREYQVPAQPSSSRRCMGALVTFEGIDLREGTPEPSAASGSHAELGNMRARRGLVLLPDTNARQATSWGVRIEVW
ncbi:hypothetical protein HDU86_002700 [Geranomyces michiganensis]|nr:hypothetical protein HDU86_002700 [Geranomyces michiganensis]